MSQNETYRLFLVEDDRSLAESLGKVLRSEGYRVDYASSGSTGLERLKREPFDLVITDMRLPGLGGLELVRQLQASKPGLPVILLTAHGTAETAIEATKRGAFDYLLKPFSMPDLLAIISRGLDRKRSRNGELKSSTEVETGMVGRSRAMQDLFKEIGRVARQNITILIRGETGTGKEMVARAIWRHSGREKQPFLAINCAAIPETLLESELFGHEKGAFTGAEARHIGRFEQAHGGTLFLDEIGDVSAATQVRLLRVLQERVIQRIGGRDTISIDVRVIAATHSNLEETIRSGAFRDDLFYRLSSVQLRVPPLRDRIEDVPVLVEHFTSKISRQLEVPGVTWRSDALDRLAHHSWPGNVRELENVVRRTLIAAQGFDVTRATVEEALSGAPTSLRDDTKTLSGLVNEALLQVIRDNGSGAYGRVVSTAEGELLRQAMELAHGNKSRAARWLGLSRLTLREKLQHHGLYSP